MTELSAPLWSLPRRWQNAVAAAGCAIFLNQLTLGATGKQRSPRSLVGISAANPETQAAMSVLRDECLSCHNGDKHKGGLNLATADSALKGGENGPVITPKKPGESLLVSVLAADAEPHMPPKRQLTVAQITVLQSWIQRGAPWDAATLAGETIPLRPVTLASLPDTYLPVNALAIAPNGKLLAAGRGDRLLFHDLTETNFPLRQTFQAHQDAVQSLAWSPDGAQVVSGAFRQIRWWEATTGAPVRTVSNSLSGQVTAMAFSPDGRHLVIADSVGGQRGILRVLEADTGKETSHWEAHRDTIFSLQFAPGTPQLATAGGDRLIKLWDWREKKESARFEGHQGAVLGVSFNTNGTQLVSAGADKEIKVWDVQTREKLIALGQPRAGLNAVVWNTAAQQVIAATESGDVFSYRNLQVHTGAQSSESATEKQLGTVGDAAVCLAATPDGKVVVVGGQNGSIHVWTDEGKTLATLKPELRSPSAAPPARTVNSTASEPTTTRPRKTASKPSKHRAPAAGSGAPASSTIAELVAEPSELTLSLADLGNSRRVVITAKLTNGWEVDLTDRIEWRADSSGVFDLDAEQAVRPRKAGRGTLTARWGGRKVQIPVLVPAVAAAGSAVSFVRDVLPVLSKAGCNAGGCHAKPDGQNGFKLSVFSFDPRGDFAEIVKDARGRRIFPSAPEESLLLLKPTLTVPHEGGRRFAPDSDAAHLLHRWLREGMAYQVPQEPKLTRLAVFPHERSYRAGATQRLLVTATYSDGSIRDVTGLAGFDANDKELARVSEEGVVTVGKISGQGVIVARYQGLVADTKILVPAEHLLPPARYAGLPRNNFVDDLAYAQFQRLGLFPSEPCSEAEFLRRVSLDTIGVLPSANGVRSFLDKGSSSNPADRRAALVDDLLKRPAYADYWANKFADLLRPNPDRVGVKSIYVLDQWLRDAFRRNLPYDQFVREILTAEGSNHREGPAVIYRDRREPADLTTMFSQLFLGTRLECARCHHHPNEKWGQEDFYQLAAFFGPLKQKGAGLSPPISAGTESFYFAPGGTVKHPVSGEVMPPRAPDGPVLPEGLKTDPRLALADWLTQPENPFFARAIVNRVWANFFGRGLVEPVDDFRISNPCVNSPLLDALAADFVRHGYDLKHLIRTLVTSRLYQQSTEPNETNLSDTRSFSRSYRRRLPAEVLLDAVNDITGVHDTFAAVPANARAAQTWSYKIDSPFLDAFGRPNSSSDCPCERDTKSSVVQALHLMNSKELNRKLTQDDGWVTQLAKSPRSPAEIVTELYLATVSRFPTETEITKASAPFQVTDANRQTATEDVLWALLNSAEFVLNH